MKTLLTIPTPPTKTKARRIPIESGVKDAVFSPELKALLESTDQPSFINASRPDESDVALGRVRFNLD